MAIKPETEFVGKIIAGNANYPQGEARNITIPGDGTGTPWKARLINDIWGFLQRLLVDASITPSGNPDTVLASDYKTALDQLFTSKIETLPLARMGTVLADATTVVSANTNIDIVLQPASASHRFYVMSIRSAGVNPWYNGVIVSEAELVSSGSHAVISRTQTQNDGLSLTNGRASPNTAVYKIYELQET